jgi:hypothetical protein
VDQNFEKAWSQRIEAFIAYGQSGELADYYFIPNVGEWVTSRDTTDYSGADGVLVEGFGRWVNGEYFSVQNGDWQMQMDRILALSNMDKILLLQQYVDKDDISDRLFLLSSYLLVKGRFTYLNLEWSAAPEWFPEYALPIGSPVGSTPSTVSALWRADWKLYVRSYSNGLVLVNPGDEIQTVALRGTYYEANPIGGGSIPASGDISSWRLEYTPVTEVTLEPHQGVVLLIELP